MNYLPVEQVFGALFVDLHMSGIWSDGKSISDAQPRYAPEVINRAYQEQKERPGFDLKSFFETHFAFQPTPASGFESEVSQGVTAHLKRLWPLLLRDSDQGVEGSSLVPLPYSYIVPGGRFNEIYYWDSYFTQLGLKAHGLYEVIRSMVDNFAWMIDRFGFIPNGNRTYFLGRSQPPFFSMMVELLASVYGDQVGDTYLPQLEKEHSFWMTEVDELTGFRLNKYFDRLSGPRPEMYATDLHDAQSAPIPTEFYRHVRAACASGWDFSARWFEDPNRLATIRAADIAPVDLQCLLFHLEQSIAAMHRRTGSTQFEYWNKLAQQRKEAIQQLFWNPEIGYFSDIYVPSGQHTSVPSLAGVFPLALGVASQEQADRSAAFIEAHFLQPGGVISTSLTTGQQWDAPNGWAPLQYMTVLGLNKYGHQKLADLIRDRWVALNERVFEQTGKMMEKYNVVAIDLPSGGGEYPVQDGFGWTNGVLAHFLAQKNG